MRNQSFYCETCGMKVAADVDKCPQCGNEFWGVKCPVCGLSGSEKRFINGCPSCGFQSRPNNKEQNGIEVLLPLNSKPGTSKQRKGQGGKGQGGKGQGGTGQGGTGQGKESRSRKKAGPFAAVSNMPDRFVFLLLLLLIGVVGLLGYLIYLRLS